MRIVDQRARDGDMVSLAINITEQMRIWAAIEAIPDGFVLFDREERLLTCNQRYRDTYPASAPAMVPGARFEDILRHGLALWDTLESCTITGASDASIRDVVPNDIAGLLAKAPIEAVFCNGATAYKIYTKYLEPVSGIPAVRLPSTSPANAACRPEKLREIWQKELSNWILP